MHSSRQKKQAAKDCNLTTPTLNNIPAYSKKEDIETLANPGDVASPVVTFTDLAVFIRAPFLRDFILNTESRDPSELAPLALAAAKGFDTTHKESPAFTEKAVSCTEDFTCWAQF